MTIKTDELRKDLQIDNDEPHGYFRRDMKVHKFGDGRAEIMITESGEKRSKICSMELKPEQISFIVKFLSSDVVKKAYDEGEKFGFRKGLEARQGRFGKLLVPERKYTSNGQIKRALLTAIFGAIKNYEDSHGKLIMPKGLNKTSLVKRIAGNVYNVFERVECSINRNNLGEGRI